MSSFDLIAKVEDNLVASLGIAEKVLQSLCEPLDDQQIAAVSREAEGFADRINESRELMKEVITVRDARLKVVEHKSSCSDRADERIARAKLALVKASLQNDTAFELS
jgi:hypothetical protein